MNGIGVSLHSVMYSLSTVKVSITNKSPDTCYEVSSQVFTENNLAGNNFRVTDQSSVLGKNGAPLTAIVGGDINGDGVPDLAVAQGGGVRVIPQRPTTE